MQQKTLSSVLQILEEHFIDQVLENDILKNISIYFFFQGDTINPLTIELDELAKRTGVRIDLKKEENVYCVDNEVLIKSNGWGN